MAYNELFALAFVAPYLASEKRISPEVAQEMMRQSLYHVRFYFSMVNLNTPKGKLANQKSILNYVKWYTSAREKQYPGSFKVDFVGKSYEGGLLLPHYPLPHLRLLQKAGRGGVDALFCELDEVMITLQHGVLHRRQTIASGGDYCDYFIVGDREK